MALAKPLKRAGSIWMPLPRGGARCMVMVAQTELALTNLSRVLVAAGASIQDVVKYNVYLTRREDLTAWREVRRCYFTGEPPAAALVFVPGPADPDFLAEVEVIAVTGWATALRHFELEPCYGAHGSGQCLTCAPGDFTMLITVFGSIAVGIMLLSYWLESRSRWFVLVFAVASAMTSVYSGLVAAYPITVIEALWAVVALRRFALRSRAELAPMPN